MTEHANRTNTKRRCRQPGAALAASFFARSKKLRAGYSRGQERNEGLFKQRTHVFIVHRPHGHQEAQPCCSSHYDSSRRFPCSAYSTSIVAHRRPRHVRRGRDGGGHIKARGSRRAQAALPGLAALRAAHAVRYHGPNRPTDIALRFRNSASVALSAPPYLRESGQCAIPSARCALCFRAEGTKTKTHMKAQHGPGD